MKSETSVVEEEMKELIILCQDIIDDSHLKPQDARKIVYLLEKGLMKIEELRISRDNSSSKCEVLRKQRNHRVDDKKLKQMMAKSFKMGKEKYECGDYPMRLWIEGEIKELREKE